MGHGSGFPATVPIESVEGNRSVGGAGTPALSTGLPQRCNPVTKRGAHGAVGGGGINDAGCLKRLGFTTKESDLGNPWS